MCMYWRGVLQILYIIQGYFFCIGFTCNKIYSLGACYSELQILHMVHMKNLKTGSARWNRNSEQDQGSQMVNH